MSKRIRDNHAWKREVMGTRALGSPAIIRQEARMDRKLTPGEAIEIAIELSDFGMELNRVAGRRRGLRNGSAAKV
ncbi:MAG TPA: hypothetical protein VKX17_15760 [Planctomycetota bacterium]|nr:hypothetical protein [Planctomycetota bacterium]